MSDPVSDKPLAGRRVAVPETRELDRLAAIFEEEGAETVRCPLVAILDAPDPAPVDAFVRDLAAGGLDDLVLLTGEGLRRLVARADALGVREGFRAALGRVRKVTRGPKPARALHELGLASDLPARTPTTGGVIEALAVEVLRGRRVGVQLYGSDPNEALVSFLTQAGAEVRTVAPYVYAPASDADRVVALIRDLDQGRLDAIAFTSASQVDRVFEVAAAQQRLGELRRGLGRTLVAAVGPVAAEALRDREIAPQVTPGKPFVMKRLVAAVVEAFSRAGVPPRTDG